MAYTVETVAGHRTFGEKLLAGEWDGPTHQLCQEMHPVEPAETQKTDYSAGDPTLIKIRAFVRNEAASWETETAARRRANLLGTHVDERKDGFGAGSGTQVSAQGQAVNLLERATQYQLKKQRPYVIPERESKEVILDQLLLFSRYAPDSRVGFFVNGRGRKLFMRCYEQPADRTPKGVVIYHHGILAHCSHYIKNAKDEQVGSSAFGLECLKQGYNMYAYEAVGHGHSQPDNCSHGRQHHPNGMIYTRSQDERESPCDWDREDRKHIIPPHVDLMDDLEQFWSEVKDRVVKRYSKTGVPADGVPTFQIGESWGGLLVKGLSLRWAEKPSSKPKNFAGTVLLSSALSTEVPGYPVLKALLGMAWSYPAWTPFFMPHPVKLEKLLHDQSTLHPVKHDPYGSEGAPVALQTGVNIISAMREVQMNFGHAGLEGQHFFALHGVQDLVCPASGAWWMYEETKANMELCLVDGGIHNLLMDFYAPEARKQMLDWIGRRVDSIGAEDSKNKNVASGDGAGKKKNAGTAAGAGGGGPHGKSVRVVPFDKVENNDPARLNTSDPKSILMVWKKRISDII